MAQKKGNFKSEIAPIEVTWINPETKQAEKRVISEDDGIRETTVETLGKLKPAFERNGLSTGGNSSQVTDGAAAVLLMTRKRAQELGLKILGKIISHKVVGVEPDMMGIGPYVAIPELLKMTNMKIEDIDVFEINEAFASQCSYCIQALGIDETKVNPNGGAIALGHPLGTTGARQVGTLLYELIRQKKKFGVISMCIGTGMGAAGLFEAEF